LLLVLSPRAVLSKWVRHELLNALQPDRCRDRIASLVIRQPKAERLSWTLPSIQAVDFRKGFDDGCRDLLALWGLGLRDGSAPSLPLRRGRAALVPDLRRCCPELSSGLVPGMQRWPSPS
jgi:hypothetical protein